MSINSARTKGFMGRWSERKHGTATKADSEPESDLRAEFDFENPSDSVSLDATHQSLPTSRSHADAISADRQAADSEAKDAEPPLLCDADMPPIESLDASSDVSDFFNKGVSAALRRAALRQVFRSPVYNVRDGLNDYDGDYTVFEPLGDTITSDMKFHAARKERDRLAREAELQENDAQLSLSGDEEATGAGKASEDQLDERLQQEGMDQHADAADQSDALKTPVHEEDSSDGLAAEPRMDELQAAARTDPDSLDSSIDEDAARKSQPA